MAQEGHEGKGLRPARGWARQHKGDSEESARLREGEGLRVARGSVRLTLVHQRCGVDEMV